MTSFRIFGKHGYTTTISGLGGICILCLTPVGTLHAAPIIWTGQGDTAQWSNVANWQSDASPQNSDQLHFAGAERLANLNDIVALQTSGIVFDPDAGAFTLQGNTLHSGGDIINNSQSMQTIDLDLTVQSDQSWSDNGLAPGSGFDFNGDIALNSQLQISGARDISIDGEIAGIDVDYGDLIKNGAGALTLSATTRLDSITINDGGSLNLAGSHALSVDGRITANDTSTINLQGSGNFSEEIIRLYDSSSFNLSGSLNGHLTNILVANAAVLDISGTLQGFDIVINLIDNGSLDNSGTMNLGEFGSITASGTSVINSTGALLMRADTTVRLQDSSIMNASGQFALSTDGGLLITEDNSSFSYSGSNTTLGSFQILDNSTVSLSGDAIVIDNNFHIADDSSATLSGDDYEINQIFAQGGLLNLAGDNYRIGDFGSAGGTTNLTGSNTDLMFRSLVNSGSFNVSGNDTTFLEGLDINGGNVDISGANTRFLQDVNINAGTLSLSGEGSITELPGLNNRGVFSTAGKTEGISLGADIINDGLIIGTSGPHQLEMTGDVSGSGNFQGNTVFNGSYSPGASYLAPIDNIVLASHEYSLFGSNSLLMMQLGGLGRGTEYDAIDALAFDLGGILQIDLLDLGNAFMPMAGNSFDLLRAGAINGNFSALNFGNALLTSGLAWSANIVTEGEFDIFRLSVIPGAPVSEPGTLMLLAVALSGLFARHAFGGARLNYLLLKP